MVPRLMILACLATAMVLAEVQENFSPECREFLFMGTPPRGLEGPTLKKICQWYNGKARYITLYDVVNHIPVYSAYTFKRNDGSKQVDVPWMYEPQLSTVAAHREMQPFPLENGIHDSFEDAQAVLEDYSNTVKFERGHLNPDEHQYLLDDKAATYTLTNIVPQAREFNIGQWKKHEHILRRRLNNYCRGTAYVVTGITTSGSMIRRHNTYRVAIPSYLWSAYCCVDYDHNAPFEERAKFPAFAVHGLNENEGEVVEMSVQKLEGFLRKNTYVDESFQIFYEDCVPTDTSFMHF
ncbi:endonuclease domain-containing 1 protein [Alosa alosa]|nr:endonuclease domain-containing 1 protein [Alosa sapidissima]XP_041947958.1 endonuclease domain-containing 1 protein [Alosa sapidissima]XP_041947959.1 endonuclease domain-containing 1 protein [Alosa sapidissima]XP_048090691.1 endonuclease domain-containing 1 protein [Alosa alosa]